VIELKTGPFMVLSYLPAIRAEKIHFPDIDLWVKTNKKYGGSVLKR